MDDNLFAALCAASVALATAFAGPAWSQDQLRQNVQNRLVHHGVDVGDIDALTTTQVSQIDLILNTSESDCCKADMIERVLAQPSDCTGNAQLRDSVSARMTQLGLGAEAARTLSGAELAMIEAVLTSTESQQAKTGQIRRILDSESQIVGNAQFQNEVGDCVRAVNAQVDLTTLTPAQLVEIELVAGGTESDASKRQMIERIADR